MSETSGKEALDRLIELKKWAFRELSGWKTKSGSRLTLAQRMEYGDELASWLLRPPDSDSDGDAAEDDDEDE